MYVRINEPGEDRQMAEVDNILPQVNRGKRLYIDYVTVGGHSDHLVWNKLKLIRIEELSRMNLYGTHGRDGNKIADRAVIRQRVTSQTTITVLIAR